MSDATPCPDEELLVDWLEGRLPAAALASLHAHVDGCASCLAVWATLAHTGAPVAGVSEPAEGQVVSHYRLEARLGRGGMGVVYRAQDLQLKRTVALKFISPLLAGDEQATARFVREAQVASALDHPNVASIFEIGRHHELHFIAMALCEGETLKQRLERGQIPVAECASIVRQMASGLGAAHQGGIVHRDIKPANVMLSPSGQVRILDFGLAKLAPTETGSLETLTATHQILGTLQYMAPEQHEGGAIDRRADLWSLGVVAYEMLGGAPPFGGASRAALALAALHDDPTPLRQRNPSVPPDLETIVMKCLEKDPARRYQTAEALAGDLDRERAHEPIAARPASFGYRMLRRTRRHRAVVVALSLGVAVAALLVGFGVRQRSAAGERARRAQALGRSVQQLSSVMHDGHLMPLHDTHRERQIVRARMQEIEASLARLGKEGEGPGHYGLGVGHLALNEHADAKRELERAWAAGERGPEVAYALGLTLSLLHEFASRDEVPAENATQRREREQKLQRDYRDPALAYLRLAAAAHVTSTDYVEARIAYLEQRYDDAIRLAHRVFAETPELYEAGALEAHSYGTLARQKWRAGNVDAAMADFRHEGELFRRVIEIARSDEAVYRSYADWLVEAASLQSQRGVDASDNLRLAAEACDRSMQANSEIEDARALASIIYWQMAESLPPAADPRPLLKKALALAEEAVAHNKREWRAWFNIGNAEGMIADWENAHGLDPRPSLDRSIAGYRASLAITSDQDSFQNLGSTYSTRGAWERRHGIDPRRSYDEARRSFLSAIAMAPDNERPQEWLADALTDSARYQIDHAIDPRPTLAEALAHAEAGQKLNRSSPNGPGGVAEVLCMRGLYELGHGLDARATLSAGLASAQAACKLNPKRSDVRNILATCRWAEAEAELARGEDVTAALEGVRRATRESFAADAGDREARLLSARAELTAAKALSARGRDATRPLAVAAAESARLLAGDGQDTDAQALAGEIDKLRQRRR